MKDDFYKEVFENDTAELEKIVSQRYKMLNEKGLSILRYHDEMHSIEEGFISDEVEIFISDLSLYVYSLKGIDYLDFCHYLKNKIEKGNENQLVSILVKSFFYVSNYFNMDFQNNRDDIREKLIELDYNNNKGKDSNYVSSISIFKGNGTGRCLEHALLLQNLLSFIGIDTSFFWTVQMTDGRITGHCFNVININDKNIFIDLVNVNVLENNKLEPVISVISKEEYNCLKSGEIFEVERIDYTRESGKKLSQYMLFDYYIRGKRFPGEDSNIRKKCL